jgi:hypothetical protein
MIREETEVTESQTLKTKAVYCDGCGARIGFLEEDGMKYAQRNKQKASKQYHMECYYKLPGHLCDDEADTVFQFGDEYHFASVTPISHPQKDEDE